MIKQTGPLAAMLSLMDDCVAPRSYFFYDAEADFSTLTTYAIDAGEPPGASPELSAVVEGAIDGELPGRGYRKAARTGERADLIMRYGVEAERGMPARPLRVDGGVEGGGEVRVDVLTIEAVRAKSDAAVWRGTRVRAIREGGEGDAARNERVAQWVTDLLGCFPVH